MSMCPSCGGMLGRDCFNTGECAAITGDIQRRGYDDGEPNWQSRALAAEARNADLLAEIADLKQSVIAFCAPWAVTYARDFGFPEGHLHPTHYDILERCGARMVDFTRGSDPALLHGAM